MPDNYSNLGQIKALNLSIGSGNGEGKWIQESFKRQKKKDLYLTILCLPVGFFC